jgi:hypothetical protein
MKDNIDSHERWNPKDAWLDAHMHPARPGSIHKVCYGANGWTDTKPFEVFFTHSRVWRRIEPADRFGHRELGPPIDTTNLFFLLRAGASL